MPLEYVHVGCQEGNTLRWPSRWRVGSMKKKKNAASPPVFVYLQSSDLPSSGNKKVHRPSSYLLHVLLRPWSSLLGAHSSPVTFDQQTTDCRGPPCACNVQSSLSVFPEGPIFAFCFLGSRSWINAEPGQASSWSSCPSLPFHSPAKSNPHHATRPARLEPAKAVT